MRDRDDLRAGLDLLEEVLELLDRELVERERRPSCRDEAVASACRVRAIVPLSVNPAFFAALVEVGVESGSGSGPSSRRHRRPACGCAPRARRSASTVERLARSCRCDAPSRVEAVAGSRAPSHSASVIGTAIAAITTSRRSRGEIRSQKSRALSVIAHMATSHALRVDGELELLDVPFSPRSRVGAAADGP